ncbi:MAG: lactate utilization protein [Desulfobacterales bacterium]|nr:lactate utilization protein [Desulfobacterales bacterium]
MKDPIGNFHSLRLAELKETLEANNFEVYIAENTDQAREIVTQDIIPATQSTTIAWGGSMTLMGSGIPEALKADDKLDVIDAKEEGISPEEKAARIKRAMTADLYFTGTNAITDQGFLVNLDMVGNRVGALTFGPKNVVVLTGQNKWCADVESAMNRIKEYAAPANAMRLDMKTPCVKTGYCMDCNSPQRICNTWTITEKSFPKNRVKIVLIKEELGL